MPVALVIDKLTKSIPFDTSIINCYRYNYRLEPWTLKEEITNLSSHIKDTFDKSEGSNSLWKYFGITQTGTFSTENAEIGEKIDFLIKEVTSSKERERAEQALVEYMGHLEDMVKDRTLKLKREMQLRQHAEELLAKYKEESR
jgi:hypothetical protein